MKLFSPSDDFFTDRLCHRYGSLVFLVAAIVIAGAYSSNGALSCWAPSHFAGSWMQFTHETCWNNGKFTVLDLDGTSLDTEEATEFDLSKLRYFPIVLLLQILVFLAPHVFWRTVTTLTGYITERLVSDSYAISRNTTLVTNDQKSDALGHVQTNGPTDAQRGYDVLAANLISALKSPFPFFGGLCSFVGGYVLIIAYMLTKIGYLLTGIVQMSILSAYLDVNFYTLHFGDKLWDDVTATRSKEVTIDNATVHQENETLIFPRNVLCQFKIARLGNVQRYGVQCELSANITIERITVCLWLWLWFTFFLLCVTTVTWVIRAAFYFTAPKSYKTARVKTLLGRQNAALSSQTTHDKDVDEFAQLLLKPDGALILEMLEDNVSMVAASEVVKAAWHQFQTNAGQGGTNRQTHGKEPGTMIEHRPQPHYGAAQGQPVVAGVYPTLSEQPGAAPETVPLMEKTNF